MQWPEWDLLAVVNHSAETTGRVYCARARETMNRLKVLTNGLWHSVNTSPKCWGDSQEWCRCGPKQHRVHESTHEHTNTQKHTHRHGGKKGTCMLSCCCPRCRPGSPASQWAAATHLDCSAEEALLSALQKMKRKSITVQVRQRLAAKIQPDGPGPVQRFNHWTLPAHQDPLWFVFALCSKTNLFGGSVN